MPRVVVVGLGPAGPEFITAETAVALERVEHRFVRTKRHPSASVTTWDASFDSYYETASSIEEVYPAIVAALVEAATEHREVLYAVPGSPDVAERTVELLRSDGRVESEVIPAFGFLDLVWNRLGVDPVACGARIIDGQRFATEAAGERGPLLVCQCDSRDVLSEVKLAFGDSPPPNVTVLRHLGLSDEAVFDVPGDSLDREIDADHLTSLWIPTLAAPVAGEVAALAEVVRTLRERCPWDREQTHATLTRHLLEETYEVLEAIEGLPDSFDHLEEELGDLLFQVVFHSTIAAQEGRFTLAEVARGIRDKLVRRHPHVFADAVAETAEAVMGNWEQLKKAEKGRESVMEGIPGELPSLLYTLAVQRKAASMGVHPDTGGPAPDALGRFDVDVLGALLFGLVDLAREHHLDPEAALRAAAGRFRDRFSLAERLAEERGVPVAQVWDQVGQTGS